MWADFDSFFGGIRCRKLSNRTNKILKGFLTVFLLVTFYNITIGQAANLQLSIVSLSRRIEPQADLNKDFFLNLNWIKIELAGNEYETLQLVIVAVNEMISGVRIETTPLVNDNQCIIPAESIKCM